MQVIRTRYAAPTNYKSARVTATCAAGSKSVPWDDALNIEENHNAARATLCAKLGWALENGYKGAWHCGQFTDGAFYHVFTKEK